MTADELANTLRKREEAIASGKSLAQITEEEAAAALERQTIQDKFNAAILKLQDFFGNLVAGPLGSFLDILSKALNIINYILTPIQMMYDFAMKIGNVIGGWLDSLGVVGKILKVIAGVAIILAAYSAAASVATYIPFVGWALAPIVAAGILGLGFGLLNSKKAGDMVSPADGKTQVSTKEGGLFELSQNDDLVAFPGAAEMANGEGKDNTIGASITGGKGKGEGGMAAAMSAFVSTITSLQQAQITATNSVKAAIDKLYAKDQSINMDGKKVGTTLVQSSYKVA